MVLFSIRPAKIMDPPLGISRVVSARRTEIPGTETPPTVTPVELSISLTSVLIFMLIRPSDSTTGVKPSPMPNLLN